MTTTVRMVHSTMEAMPTARLMKEKLRASREAISAVTMSPLAIAVRTYVMAGGKGMGEWESGGMRKYVMQQEDARVGAGESLKHHA